MSDSEKLLNDIRANVNSLLMLLGGPHPESLSSYVDSLINIIKIYGSKCKQEALERIATPVPVLDPAITGEQKEKPTVKFNDLSLLDQKVATKERKIIDYKIAISDSGDWGGINNIVKEFIKKGWEPLSGISMTYNTENDDWDAWQAMVKYAQ